jgi:hypothetical protein
MPFMYEFIAPTAFPEFEWIAFKLVRLASISRVSFMVPSGMILDVTGVCSGRNFAPSQLKSSDRVDTWQYLDSFGCKSGSIKDL